MKSTNTASHAPPPSLPPRIQDKAIHYADLSMSELVKRHQHLRPSPLNHEQLDPGLDICYADIKLDHLVQGATSQPSPLQIGQEPETVDGYAMNFGDYPADAPNHTYKSVEPNLTPPVPARTYWYTSPNKDMHEKIAKLEEEYAEIEGLVLETIGEENVPVKKMLQWVQVLPMVLKAQFSELLQTQAKAMSTASNTDELFFILSQYWNSLHPSLLEHLVKKLKNAILKDRMSCYVKELRTFRSSTTLGEFVDKWVGRVPPALNEFVMEVGDEWKTRTLHDLEQFRILLSRQKCFNGQMPYVKKVTSGSVFLVFATSHSMFPLNFKQKSMLRLLKENHILRVFVEGKCILHLETSKDETKNSSDESSHYSSSVGSDAEYDDQGSLPSKTSSEHSFPCTISRQLKWHPGTELALSDDCLVVHAHATSKGEAHVLQPLHRTGEFEIMVEARGPNTRDGFLGIGIRRRQHKSPKLLNAFTSNCIWETGAIVNALENIPSTNGYKQARDLDLLIKGDRIGMKITQESDLEFFVNGLSQGIAASNVYKPSNGYELYPRVKLPAGYAVRITSGATCTGVICLQDLCIEAIARSIKSFEDIKSLTLPASVKDKISKLVLDPSEDFTI